MAGISEGRYKDFLLQEIMVFGLERRWSAVDTCNTHKITQTITLKLVVEMYVVSLLPHMMIVIRVVCSDLVDAEVSHPENNGAGHELSLGTLRRGAEGSAGRGAYLTWRERKKGGRVEKEE